MRVRPFFWFILVFACGGVLVFAATHCTCGPAILQVHVAQNPGPTAITIIDLHATDPDGLPLDGAQILPNARMTNMNMMTHQIYTTPQGQGNYLLRLRLSMAGPWAVTISMQAQGFATLNRTIFVQVQPANGLSCTVGKSPLASLRYFSSSSSIEHEEAT
jgi:hypothetical protein